MAQKALVVGCGKQKVWRIHPGLGRVPAKDAYVSSLFRLSRRYAERHFPQNWFILSALHGLMSPDEQITDYDVELNTGSNHLAEATLRIQCAKLLAPYSEVVCFAGKAYSQLLKRALAVDQRIETPLMSLGLFERMKWLKLALSSTRSP